MLIKRVKTGNYGEGRHVFVCRKFPFEMLRSPNYPSQNETLIDENFVHKVKLDQTNVTCENFRFAGQNLRIVGRISTTVQTVANGVPVGNMQLKATVVRDLKSLLGTEALPGAQLREKLLKFETSQDLSELRTMKLKDRKQKIHLKHSKPEPTPTELPKEIESSYIESFLAKFNPYRPKSLSTTTFDSELKIQKYLSEPESPSPTECPTESPARSTTSSSSSNISSEYYFAETDPLHLDPIKKKLDYDDSWQPLSCVTPLRTSSPPKRSATSTPEPNASPHFYKDENQKQYAKYMLYEDSGGGAKNLYNMKYIPYTDLPHGPIWCRELCRDFASGDRPEQCGH